MKGHFIAYHPESLTSRYGRFVARQTVKEMPQVATDEPRSVSVTFYHYPTDLTLNYPTKDYLVVAGAQFINVAEEEEAIDMLLMAYESYALFQKSPSFHLAPRVALALDIGYINALLKIADSTGQTELVSATSYLPQFPGIHSVKQDYYLGYKARSSEFNLMIGGGELIDIPPTGTVVTLGDY